MDANTTRSRHPDAIRKTILWVLLPTLALVLSAPSVGDAQVATNITSTTGAGDLGTTVTPDGNLYNITGGTRPGNGSNLFHSFGDFSVGAGDIGNFFNNTGLSTSNILSRVTGGNISNIYGNIRTTDFGNANLFLVNPSGIVFGPNGSVNVGGSVSFTTAQYLRLFDEVTGNSANFFANHANDGLANSVLSVLAVAPVVEFGFLSPAAYGFLTAPDPSVTITVQGSALSVLPGQSISLVGGNVVIEGATLPDGTVQSAQLSASNGTIQLASAASPGEFAAPPGESLANAMTFQAVPNNPVDAASAASFTAFGSVSLAPSSSIDVSGANTVVFIKGGQLVLSVNDATLSTSENPAPSDTISLSPGSSIATSNSGAEPGADAQLTVGNLNLDGSTLTTGTFGDGNGGNLTANVGTLSLTNGAAISSDNFSFTFGEGGNVTVQGLAGPGSAADAVTLDSGATLTTQTFGFGGSGDVELTAATLGLDGFGTALTTATFGDGNGGNLTANVGTLSLTNGAAISSNNFSFGLATSGNLTVQGVQGADSAADAVTLDNSSQIATQTFGFGPSGDVELTAATLGLDGFGTALTTATFGDGNSGNLTANVGTLSLTNGAAISSNNFSFGLATSGNLTVQGVQGADSAADAVTLDNFATISTETFFGLGHGGDIDITAHTLQMENLSEVRTGTLFGGGVGGDIVQNVETLTLNGGSAIRTTDLTFGIDLDFDGLVDIDSTGAGGQVTIQGIQGPGSVAESVVLSGGSRIVNESLDGNGGQLSIAATSVNLDGASTVNSSAFGLGHGGDIEISVQNASFSEGSTLSSNTVFFAPPGKGVGGTITVHGLDGQESMADSLTLTGFRSGIIIDSFGSALPGDIEVNAKTVNLTDGAVIEGGSTFSEATGGNVTINAEAVDIVSGSHISSQARAQDAGAVTITADQLTLDDGSILTTTVSETGGRGGDVVLNVGAVSLLNGSTINSSTSQMGRAGDITVIADQSITVDTSSSIAANTTGQGDAGNVQLNAGTVTVTNGSQLSSSTQPPEGFVGEPSNLTGNAGDIGITTTGNSLIVSNGGAIASASQTGGNAGTISITTPSLTLDNGIITTSASSTGNAGGITANVGAVTLTNNAEISSNSKATASGNAGTVTIQGQGGPDTSATSLALTNSSLVTNTEGTGAGGDIQIRAGQVQLADLASLTAETFGTGKAGSIKVTSDNLSVTGGARIEASTAGVGDAGDITITNTDTVSVTGLSSNGSTRSGIFAKTQSSGGITGGGSGSGSGGGGGGSGGGGQPSTAGDAGNIVITTNNLLLSGGAQIDSSTTTSGSGGRVSVNADAIRITGTSTSLRSDASRGNGAGGDIALAAITIGIYDKASVTAATDGSGNAGNISMTANESFTLDSAAIITTSTRGSGRGGTILINSPQVLVDGLGTSITASTLRPFADIAVTLSILHPNDGDLTVRLDSPDGTRVALLSRVGGSGDNFTGTIFDDLAAQPITSGSAPFTGPFKPREPLAQLIDQIVAGTWKLNVSDQVVGNTESPQSLESWSLRVVDQVYQSTNTPRNIPDSGSVSSNLVVAGPVGAVVQGLGEVSGDGGDVTINAGTLTVQNGATLSATTRGSGQGGTVNVNATGPVALVGSGTGLFTNSEASGGSGNVNVVASGMTMNNGAKVSAASSGTGDAGNITIHSASTFMMNNSKVTTEASQASGGQIEITAPEMVRLINSQVSTSVAGSATDTAGGNITIDPQFVILQNSQIIAQAFAGSGGAINIIAGVFLADPASIVDASSTLGISGTVNIESPVQNIGGRLTPLSQQFSSAAALLAQRCAARVADGKFSTFVVAGHEGLPVEPGGFLASPSLTAELFGSSRTRRDTHNQFPAVTGLLLEYDARPIQLAMFGNACHQ